MATALAKYDVPKDLSACNCCIATVACLLLPINPAARKQILASLQRLCNSYMLLCDHIQSCTTNTYTQYFHRMVGPRENGAKRYCSLWVGFGRVIHSVVPQYLVKS